MGPQGRQFTKERKEGRRKGKEDGGRGVKRRGRNGEVVTPHELEEWLVWEEGLGRKHEA